MRRVHLDRLDPLRTASIQGRPDGIYSASGKNSSHMRLHGHDPVQPATTATANSGFTSQQ